MSTDLTEFLAQSMLTYHMICIQDQHFRHNYRLYFLFLRRGRRAIRAPRRQYNLYLQQGRWHCNVLAAQRAITQRQEPSCSKHEAPNQCRFKTGPALQTLVLCWNDIDSASCSRNHTKLPAMSAKQLRFFIKKEYERRAGAIVRRAGFRVDAGPAMRGHESDVSCLLCAYLIEDSALQWSYCVISWYPPQRLNERCHFSTPAVVICSVNMECQMTGRDPLIVKVFIAFAFNIIIVVS